MGTGNHTVCVGLALVCGLLLTGCGEALTRGPGGDVGSGSAMTLSGASASRGADWDTTGSVGLAAVGERVALRSAAAGFVAVTTPGNTAYKIGPEDLVEVSVFKVPELSRSVQVADRGTINLPLVGEVPAAGKTARDIEVDLTKRLGAKYLRSPQVTVLVKEYNSQRVTVEGAVKKPGVYPIRGKSSLLASLATAGGLEDAAETGNVIVVRQVGGQRFAGRFDIDAIRAGTADDPAIQQGDVVIANASGAKAAFQTFLKLIPVANVFAAL